MWYEPHTKWLHIYISCISYFPTLWWWYILGSPYFIPFLPCNGFAMHCLGVQFHLMGIQTGHAILPPLNSIQCLGGLEFPHNFIFPTMQQPILWFQISSNHSNHIISSPIHQPFSQIHIYIIIYVVHLPYSTAYFMVPNMIKCVVPSGFIP
jgi:hypothetical protein